MAIKLFFSLGIMSSSLISAYVSQATYLERNLERSDKKHEQINACPEFKLMPCIPCFLMTETGKQRKHLSKRKKRERIPFLYPIVKHSQNTSKKIYSSLEDNSHSQSMWAWGFVVFNSHNSQYINSLMCIPLLILKIPNEEQLLALF